MKEAWHVMWGGKGEKWSKLHDIFVTPRKVAWKLWTPVPDCEMDEPSKNTLVTSKNTLVFTERGWGQFLCVQISLLYRHCHPGQSWRMFLGEGLGGCDWFKEHICVFNNSINNNALFLGFFSWWSLHHFSLVTALALCINVFCRFYVVA